MAAGKTVVHYADSWPIVICKIRGSDHSPQMFQETFKEWTAFMQRGRHVLIADMLEGSMGHTAANRAQIAEWVKANDALLRERKQLAHILVFDSAIMRGVVMAVTWLRPPANPQRTAPNMRDALEIALSYLHEASIPIAPTALAVARRLCAHGASRDTSVRH